MTISGFMISSLFSILVVLVFLRGLIRNKISGRRNIIITTIIILLLCILPWGVSYYFYNHTTTGIEKKLAEEARREPIYEKVSVYDNGTLVREYVGDYILTRDDNTYILNEDGKIISFSGGVVIVEPIIDEEDE